ncbi:MAG: hypothetical protein WC712_00520 [Candidatus Brocadiia bacterium]
MKRAAFLLFVVVCLAISGLGRGLADGPAPSASPSKTVLPTVAAPTIGQAGTLKGTDTVYLKDGTEIVGRIIASGPKATVVVVNDNGTTRETIIPAEKIEKIVRGESKPDADYFGTANVDGKEKVVTTKKPGSPSPRPSGSGVRTSGTTGSGSPGASPRATTGTSGANSLKSNSPIALLMEKLKADPNIKGLVDVIGEQNLQSLIEQSRSTTHFARMLDNYNRNARVLPRDVVDLVNRGRVNVDDETKKRLSRYLAEIVASPRR